MHVRWPIRVVALAAVMPWAAACGTDTSDGVTLPGVDGGPAPVVPAIPPPPPPSPTSPAPDGGSTTSTAPTTDPVEPAASVVVDGGASTTTAAPAVTVAPSTTLEVVYLRRGDEGPAVASIQRRLIELEYLPAGADSGSFDEATADALIEFQAQYGLIVDGVFGPETDRALSAAAASVG